MATMNVETLTTLTGIDRVNAIAARVETLPQDLRGSTTRAYQRNLPEWEAARLKYNWLLHACDSRLPPRRPLGSLADTSKRTRLRK